MNARYFVLMAIGCCAIVACSDYGVPSNGWADDNGAAAAPAPDLSNQIQALGDAAPQGAPLDPTGRYIVLFEQGSRSREASLMEQANEVVAELDGELHMVFDESFPGFVASFSGQALQPLQARPDVAVVEPDAVIVANRVLPPWNQDRIDQRDLPLDYGTHSGPTGSGVHVYVIDSGIRATHYDFYGRVSGGQDFVGDGLGTQDCTGHGTHVAGIAAGSHYGVASDAWLHAVRVLDCNDQGYASWLIGALLWVKNNHQEPAVANMSIGFDERTYIYALNAAMELCINSGVTITAAAGNNNDDACFYSIANVPAAITVGATDDQDERCGFSNYGACLDLFAPGSPMTSDYHTSDLATEVKWGTSMAAPHAAGVAAQLLDMNPGSSPADVHQEIVDNATTGRLTGIGPDSPNRLLYTDY